ncbi:MAG TPA: DNA/RNA helicase domain-containing protein, partial [Thermoplasmataceae archaeon]|nr:DNA/RNA helicase domain-containing protein [Thermoplasmataceae archaeon]
SGEGIEVLRRIEKSSYRPSKQLMEHVAGMIHGNPEYTLLDEQLVVYDKVLSSAREGFSNGKKTVIIVKGGPGTGKSVIAINLMADLSSMKYNTHYATGSRAFTSTLREILGKRTTSQLRFFNDYVRAEEANVVDVLIADEAHRLWHKDMSRFTPKKYRSDTPIIDHMIRGPPRFWCSSSMTGRS